MNSLALQAYYSLPNSLRSLAASFRGLYLRSWRYGPETNHLVEEAIEREYWPAEKWKTWQEERLAYILHRAATKVPYYRKQWNAVRRSGKRTSWEYLENWPILEKESLRQTPMAFVADDCDVRRMFPEHTSGTTGKPIQLFWSRRVLRAWYALLEARCRRWYQVSKQDRWAILGGQMVTPVAQQTPPFWVWNAPLNQLYMSSYHLSSSLIPHYLEALKRYRVKYIWAYTSAIYAIAQEALKLLNPKDLALKVVITNAEPIFDYQRQVIAEAFQCPVRETYGMAEIVAAASECNSRQLHLWPEVGWIEPPRSAEFIPNGQSEALICTSLLNSDTPLIRYRVGDHGSGTRWFPLCECGRTLPILDSVDGRSDDILYALDGRSIGRLDPIFKSNLPIREAQIIQEDFDRIRVRYVPTQQFDDATKRIIKREIQARLGPVKICFEGLKEIPREKNGKFQSVKCNLSPADRCKVEVASRY